MDEQRRLKQGEEEGGQAAHDGSNRLTTSTVSGRGRLCTAPLLQLQWSQLRSLNGDRPGTQMPAQDDRAKVDTMQFCIKSNLKKPEIL
jgi:hypothetical protein